MNSTPTPIPEDVKKRIEDDAFQYSIAMMGYPHLTKLESYADKQMCENLKTAYRCGATAEYMRHQGELAELVGVLQEYYDTAKKSEDVGHFDFLLSEKNWFGRMKATLSKYQPKTEGGKG